MPSGMLKKASRAEYTWVLVSASVPIVQWSRVRGISTESAIKTRELNKICSQGEMFYARRSFGKKLCQSATT